MKVYLINLDKDADRLVAADAQLKKLGVDYERIPAVYAKILPQEKLDESVNHFRWWCAVGRPVRPGEIGCAMSHYSVYEKIDDFACVLEDDVVLDPRFPEVLHYVGEHLDVARTQVFLLSDHSSPKRNVGMESCGTPLVSKCRNDMYAEGYVITRKAADALRKANWPMQCPCDWWGRWSRQGIIELYHAYPTVCCQNKSQYESGTVAGDKFRVADLPLADYCWHKFKRLIGKTLDHLL